MTEPSNAIFLSYASQDAQAAQRICETLRAAGVEVWFDQSELRGGDAWDQKIRGLIQDCALFVPVISTNTASRPEGYFRLEWALAEQRSQMIARNKAFIVPVCLDRTPERGADVPESFQRVQWTRLPGGETPSAFVDRITGLLSSELGPPSAAPGAAPRISESMRPHRQSKHTLPAIGAAIVLAALTYLIADKFWFSKRVGVSQPIASAPAEAGPASTTAFAPPPHSIAVLPFVNMSGDKEQEYFSDGLTEELLNSLSRINALQVAARTSAFSFKGKDTDIITIAHKLNVGAVLEGSVRRSGHTIRITTQLINAVTGFHLWSETYDRDLGDVLKLQTEIATAVASTLKVTLLGDEAEKIEAGGTRNSAAFDAYLRATMVFWGGYSPKVIETALAGYTEAIRLDPDYALAYAARALAFVTNAGIWDTTVSAARADLARAQADADRAVVLSPELSEGHLARAVCYADALKFKEANEEYERALALGPGNSRVLRDYGAFAVLTGYGDTGLAAIRRAVALDPLNSSAQGFLGQALVALRRYPEALAAYNDAKAIPSTTPGVFLGEIGTTQYMLGDFERARASCEQTRDVPTGLYCLAMTYDKLGRRADAEAAVAKFRAAEGEGGAYQYANIYAQWGNRARALDSLETALRQRDPLLEGLKTDPLLDSLRQEPRFQAIERELQFPNGALTKTF